MYKSFFVHDCMLKLQGNMHGFWHLTQYLSSACFRSKFRNYRVTSKSDLNLVRLSQFDWFCSNSNRETIKSSKSSEPVWECFDTCTGVWVHGMFHLFSPQYLQTTTKSHVRTTIHSRSVQNLIIISQVAASSEHPQVTQNNRFQN